MLTTLHKEASTVHQACTVIVVRQLLYSVLYGCRELILQAQPH